MTTNGARPADSRSKMERVTVRVPKALLERVDASEFPNRSEAIRAGLWAVVDGSDRDD